MPTAIEGTDEITLNQALLEHFNPGDRVDLYLSLPRSLSDSETQYVADALYDYGVDVQFTEMLTAPYPSTLRIVFTRPSRTEGYAIAFLPIIPILAAIGIGVFLAWKTGQFIDTIAKNIIPLTLIFVGGGITLAWVLRQPARARV